MNEAAMALEVLCPYCGRWLPIERGLYQAFIPWHLAPHTRWARKCYGAKGRKWSVSR